MSFHEMLGLGAGAAFAGLALASFVAAIIGYVFMALVLYTLARKLNTDPAWVAWIPIVQFYLLWKMSGTETWTMIVFVAGLLLGVIPVIGWLLSIAATAMVVWWLWIVAERRNYPGWVSLLTLIPLVNLVVLGMLAWVDR